MVLPFTETPVLVEGRGGAEHLPTVFTLDLCAAVSVHTFVAAKIRELGVGLVAYLTHEGLDTAVDVLMLLEARRRCERLATVRAGMGTSPNVLRANVPL